MVFIPFHLHHELPYQLGVLAPRALHSAADIHSPGMQRGYGPRYVVGGEPSRDQTLPGRVGNAIPGEGLARPSPPTRGARVQQESGCSALRLIEAEFRSEILHWERGQNAGKARTGGTPALPAVRATVAKRGPGALAVHVEGPDEGYSQRSAVA